MNLIPVFFATDNNYVPFLEVALRSLIANTTKENRYQVIILCTDVDQENKNILTMLSTNNVEISFYDITEAVKPIKEKLRNVYHFGLASYYRLFIPNLFPQFKKAVYLDCDIVVLDDIANLFKKEIKNNFVAAVPDQIIATNNVFCEYAKEVVGVEFSKYFNSGILLMNLEAFREEQIEEKFIDLLITHNFETIAPDQDYLNVLCKGRIKYLNNGWNKESLPVPLEGKLSIVHYALYQKPWQYDNVLNDEYFWFYAKQCKLLSKILEFKNSFTEEKKAEKAKANIEIVEHAKKLIASNHTFNKVLKVAEKNIFLAFLEKLNEMQQTKSILEEA